MGAVSLPAGNEVTELVLALSLILPLATPFRVGHGEGRQCSFVPEDIADDCLGRELVDCIVPFVEETP